MMQAGHSFAKQEVQLRVDRPLKYRDENLYIIVLYITNFVISPLERSKAIHRGL
jgi:hypothetical protein